MNHEFKRLSEGLYDMVSYILKDDSGKSSEQLMREYIQTNGDPMQINGDKLSWDAYAVFKNAQIWGVGMADAYQMANILKNVYELEDSATKFADWWVWDKVLYWLKLAWDAVGLAWSEAGLLANTVFHKLPALAKYTLTTDVLFNQVGYKDWQGYNMKDFASYVYGFQDSGISRLKTRTQLKYGDSDMDNQWWPDVLRDLWSWVDDVVAAILNGVSNWIKDDGKWAEIDIQSGSDILKSIIFIEFAKPAHAVLGLLRKVIGEYSQLSSPSTL